MVDRGPGLAGALAERYLDAVAHQDWAAVKECLGPRVVREGPFGDDVEGRQAYLELLRRTMPALRGYEMEITRVTEVDGSLVFVELRETVFIEDVPVVTDECLVFVVGGGCIDAVSVYIRHASSREKGHVLGSVP